MCVLVIMGVLFSVAIKKVGIISDSASITAIKAGVRELNTQETLAWTEMKLSDLGWTADVDVYNAVEKKSWPGLQVEPWPDCHWWNMAP